MRRRRLISAAMCSTIALAPSLEEEVAPEHRRLLSPRAAGAGGRGNPLPGGRRVRHACFTGIRRSTKDLDLFIRRQDYERAAALMRAEGWRTELAYPHWLAKVYAGEDFIDLIFNSGNGLTPVDDRWFEDNAWADVLGVPVRVANMEDSMLSKAFIMERERYDGADVAHLLRANAERIDWRGWWSASATTGACCSRTSRCSATSIPASGTACPPG